LNATRLKEYANVCYAMSKMWKCQQAHGAILRALRNADLRSDDSNRAARAAATANSASPTAITTANRAGSAAVAAAHQRGATALTATNECGPAARATADGGGCPATTAAADDALSQLRKYESGWSADLRVLRQGIGNGGHRAANDAPGWQFSPGVGVGRIGALLVCQFERSVRLRKSPSHFGDSNSDCGCPGAGCDSNRTACTDSRHCCHSHADAHAQSAIAGGDVADQRGGTLWLYDHSRRSGEPG